MPRTKKNLVPELPDKAPTSLTADGLEFSQTDPEMAVDPGAGTSSDLELAATASLDPDASQTDLELPPDDSPTESEVVAVNYLPQTDSESVDELEDGTPSIEDYEGEGPSPTTDLESALDPELVSDPNEEELSEPALSQTDLELPASTPGAMHSTAGTGPISQTDSGQPQKLRMPGRRGPRVVSIDAERTVETDVDKLRSDLIDLAESLKSGKILTGTVQGIEQPPENPDVSYAVVYHGDFKVIIPALAMVEEPEDYRGQPKGSVLYYLLNKRQGAEIDYIVKGIDQQSGIVAASRLEAMAAKRREYYFRTDRDGNYRIYEGIRAEARVVSVIRAGIFVDLFGVECYIPLRELSYQRWMDAAAHYQPGQRVLVKVLEVDRSDRSHLQVTASVKQACENPYEKALKKYSVGNRYVGTVSMVDTTGVFVSLDGGIDCLCTYPKRGRPPRGCRVTVRILGINADSNRIWGVITHMSTAR